MCKVQYVRQKVAARVGVLRLQHVDHSADAYRRRRGRVEVLLQLQPALYERAPRLLVVVGSEDGCGEGGGVVGDEHVRAVKRVHPRGGDGGADHGHAQLVRRVHLALDAGAPAQRRHAQPHLAVERA
eukprot:5894788-Pleurochrysis_carterae.AAC.1